jgi:hypothetical protein
VILCSLTPGINVLDMEYSRPIRFHSSAARPLILLSPINVILFTGLVHFTLCTVFFLRVWFMLHCVSGVRFDM